MPPSISTRIVNSPESTILRTVRTLLSTSGMKSLAAETGLDRHDQKGVEVLEDVQVRVQRGAGLDAQPRLGAGGANVTGHRDGIVGRLGVERDVVGASLGVRRRPAVGVLDHQMAIHRNVAGGQQTFHHRQADRQVRHEMRIHDIDVQPVRAFDDGGLVGQPGEIGGQYRRRDQRPVGLA